MAFLRWRTSAWVVRRRLPGTVWIVGTRLSTRHRNSGRRWQRLHPGRTYFPSASFSTKWLWVIDRSSEKRGSHLRLFTQGLSPLIGRTMSQQRKFPRVLSLSSKSASGRDRKSARRVLPSYKRDWRRHTGRLQEVLIFIRVWMRPRSGLLISTRRASPYTT